MILWSVVRRLTSSAIVIDWWPVLVVPPVLILDAALSSVGKPLGVVSVLSAYVACLPLVLRRRVPVTVMVPLIVGGVVLVLWLLHPASTVVLIPMIALFELALRGDRRRSLWMSVVAVPSVIISVLPFASGFDHVASIIVRNLALTLLAIAMGELLRSRQFAARRMIDAAEQETLRRVSDERLQIAREIHDVVAHAMTAINVQAGVAAHLLERDPGQAHGALRDIKRTSGEALAELRGTLEVLRDPSQTAPLAVGGGRIGLHDLEPLIRGLLAAGISVELEVEPVADVPAAVDSAGYRIVQEALTNVARHARASNARVCVRRDGAAVTIEVTDDGCAASGAVNRTAGNGLRGMRERAAALGGTVDAAPRAAGGWRVQAWLPVALASDGPP